MPRPPQRRKVAEFSPTTSQSWSCRPVRLISDRFLAEPVTRWRLNAVGVGDRPTSAGGREEIVQARLQRGDGRLFRSTGSYQDTMRGIIAGKLRQQRHDTQGDPLSGGGLRGVILDRLSPSVENPARRHYLAWRTTSHSSDPPFLCVISTQTRAHGRYPSLCLRRQTSGPLAGNVR